MDIVPNKIERAAERFRTVDGCIGSKRRLSPRDAAAFKKLVEEIANQSTHHVFHIALGALATPEVYALLQKVVGCITSGSWGSLTDDDKRLFSAITGAYTTYVETLSCRE